VTIISRGAEAIRPVVSSASRNDCTVAGTVCETMSVTVSPMLVIRAIGEPTAVITAAEATP